MQHDKKRWRVTTVIFLPIFLALIVLAATPYALAQSGSALNTNNKMTPMTGRIDRIGTNDIVIDDTWYKLSDNVSISGYNVGNRVTFIANNEYEILEIGLTSEKRLPKE